MSAQDTGSKGGPTIASDAAASPAATSIDEFLGVEQRPA